jgi:Uma2 family endonuclease
MGALHRSPELTYDGLRKIVQRTYPAYDVEIQDGEYVVVAPHDLLSSNVVVLLVRVLDAWVRPRKLGYVFESNGGFEFPDGDKRAPDVSFVSRERLPSVPRSFARAIPELVIEVRSSTQTERSVRNQLASLLAKGCSVGVYVDPGERRVEIHRPGTEPAVLGDDGILEISDILPGFAVPVAELWPD